MSEVYIIEKRDESGQLVFTAPQPESIFGMGAIKGIKDHVMAQVVWKHKPDAVLTGDSIAAWPSLIDPQFKARRKTW